MRVPFGFFSHPLIAVLAGSSILALMTPASNEAGPGRTALDIQVGRPSSAEACRSCHSDIYAAWRRSLHGRAMQDSTFLDAYTRAQESGSGPLCLTCHAPLSTPTKDASLILETTWEGVTCSFCHAITAVDSSASGFEASVKYGSVMAGPLPSPAGAGHDVIYSPLHKTALVCAPCHEYANASGTRILTTYSEWMASPQGRRGEPCQSCHMLAQRPGVNLHTMPGGHSIEQLNKAVHIQVTPQREGDHLRVLVELSNTGAGHAVPTGSASRQLILVARLQAGTGATQEAQRVYARTLADESGRPVLEDDRLFEAPKRVLADTRIAAGERRNESFQFPLPSGQTGFLRIDLYYVHRPSGTVEGETRVLVQSITRAV